MSSTQKQPVAKVKRAQTTTKSVAKNSTPNISHEEAEGMVDALQIAHQRQALEYALARQVPEMNRGFRVATNYGDIVIEPGKLADCFTKFMQLALRTALAELDRMASRG
jgi:hypothetical protein